MDIRKYFGGFSKNPPAKRPLSSPSVNLPEEPATTKKLKPTPPEASKTSKYFTAKPSVPDDDFSASSGTEILSDCMDENMDIDRPSTPPRTQLIDTSQVIYERPKPATTKSKPKQKDVSKIAQRYSTDIDLKSIPKHTAKKPKGGEKVLGTQIVKIKEEIKEGPLKGQTFVITGVIPGYERDELADLLKSYGCRVTGSISRKTTCLVHGDKLEDGRHYTEGTKFKKAVELGVRIMNKDQLEMMLNEIIGSMHTETHTEPHSANVAQPRSRFPTSNSISKPLKQRGSELWTDKHCPKNVKELIGNNQSVEKLINWLRDWEDVILKGEKKAIKAVKGGKFDPQMNVNARAVLITGPPGIGKTTAARMVAKGMGYQSIELNASDVRSRKSVLEPMRAINDNSALNCKRAGDIIRTCIIFDEVDGMSGGDRGGTAAMIEVIKTTKIPIICIANDRQSQKLKSLANYCYDIRFHRPNKASIMIRVKQILGKEGLMVEDNALDHMIEATGNDVRQLITSLEMWAKYSSVMTYMQAKDCSKSSSKDVHIMINNFDAAAKLLRRSDQRSLRYKEKLDLFYVDYDLIPLLIHENYLSAMGANTKESLERAAEAADSIALGDLLNKKIRVDGEWTLLSCFGQASTIAPGALSGNGVPFPKFPEFFGKFSTQRKNQRLLKETRAEMTHVISGDTESVLNDYIPLIYYMIMTPLKQGDIEQALQIMSEYRVNPDMLKEHFISLQFGSTTFEQEFKDLPVSIRSNLTKLYNQYYKSSVQKIKKKKSDSADHDQFDPETQEQKEVEEELSEESDIEVKPVHKRDNKKRASNKNK
jgi:replication factor C subunit 1